MGSSTGPSTITRTIHGSGCTSRGGCVSPRRNPTEPGRNGAGAHRKGVSLRSGSKSYDSWIVLSWRGCAGSIGASGAVKPKRAASWSELLNLIAITERQLRRVMRSYVDYCREDRTRLGLEKDVPEERPIEPREMGEGRRDAPCRRVAPSLLAGAAQSHVSRIWDIDETSDSGVERSARRLIL